jgi:hypothetical protein
MASINTLSHTLHMWIRWLRLRRAIVWTVRGFAIALGVSFFIGGLGLYQARLLKMEFLALVIVSVIFLPALFGIGAYFWRIHPLKAARYFDRVFHLDERVSTALELGAEDHANGIIQKQLDDALSAARKVKPRRYLPLGFKRVDAILALIFALLLGALWLRGEALFVAAGTQRNIEAAIDAQQAKVEEIIKTINENDALTDEQKKQLTEPLEQAQQALKDNPSMEGAVSILTSASEKMQALSDEQAGQTSQALKQTGSALAAQEGSPLSGVGQDMANGDFSKAASELKNMDLSQMSPEELQKLAQQLNEMADGLAGTNPELAQQLKDAAQSIEAGDLQSAQQSLNNASQLMENASQQIAGSQAASQAAGQLQQGAGEVIAAGGGQQVGPPMAGNQPGQSNNGGAGSGSGSGDVPDSNQQGGEAGSDQIPQDNGPGDGGESTYEKMVAPSLLGGSGGDTLNLPVSGEDGEVMGTSPTTATDGESLVPYTDVYPQYDDANRQAIENGDVPPQFMDVIRNYFDSIQP